MHSWGDEGVDWKGINEAARYIGVNLRRWGRVGVTQYKEKYGCYDDKTRVLTDNGWKYFKDVNINKDLFATLDKNGYLIYKKAYDYIEYKYQGEMYYLNTRGVNLLVTPNHNLYFAKPDIHGGKKDKEFKKFSYKLNTFHNFFRKDKKFLKGAKWKGQNVDFFELPEYKNFWNNIPKLGNKIRRKFIQPTKKIKMKYWLQLLGWFLAEGCYSGTSQVSFCIHKKEIDIVGKIINKCGFDYSISLRGNYGAALHVYNTQLARWLHKHCNRTALNKTIPLFIYNLNPYLIEIFLKSLYRGDGQKTETAYILSTISKNIADGVLELLLKAGYCGKQNIRDRRDYVSFINNRPIKSNYPVFEINWLNKIEHRTSNCHDTLKQKIQKENIVNYTGKVYCVSVPNKLLYVERNGKPVWCGNSVRIYISFGLGWKSLFSITHPGWVSYKVAGYPKWLMTFDIFALSKIIPYLNCIILPYHKWLYRKLYSDMIKKYPHLREEILCCADYSDLLKDL